jgi:ABC-type nitrate/sulfonate/bicarbonate transport system permease component
MERAHVTLPSALAASFGAAESGQPARRNNVLSAYLKPYPRLGTALKGAAGIIGAIVIWELIRALHFVDPRDLPSFLAIARSATAGLWGGELALAILATIGSWAPGLFIAAALGVVAGIALALMPRFEIATRPLLEFLRPIPSVALIPVALLVLGIGLQMQLFMIAFASVWPVLFSTKAGVESVDPRFLETGRVLGLGRAARMARIVLPSTLPYVATGLRTASAIALVLAITVEMLTGRPGIGFYIENVRLNGLITEMWAAILVTGVLGYLVNAFFMGLERIALPWSPEHRAR